MSDRPPESLQTNLDQWLASLGFSRGNPFATVEADQERALLPEFFVDVDGYEHIKSDRSVIVFAPRGSGKSALRVVLASQAAPIFPEATTLAIEYTDFDALVAKQRSGQNLSVDDYVPRLLRAGAKALLDTFCGNPTESIDKENAIARRFRAQRVRSIPPPTRSRLAHLLRAYYPSLLEPAALYERLQLLDPTFAPTWHDFIEVTTERRLRELISRSVLKPSEIANLLADLNDYPETSADSAITITEKIISFVHLTRATGLVRVQFLIDRLDELVETVDDPETQADILEPLLSHLPLLEIPGAAFKLFLSQEARNVLIERPKIRRDRLTDQAVTVSWSKARLKHLLDERLVVYSDGQVHDLTQLCREVLVDVGRGRERQPRRLGEWVEDEMLQLAQSSPRRLLVAAQQLCQVHVEQSGSSGLLEKVDWETAKIELLKKMPPKLRLHRTEPIAAVGDREVPLTQLEHRILQALLAGHGRCDREMLADTVWGAGKGISNYAIDQAIGRLRDKLGDDPSYPTYLRTERGTGFVLLNYEVE